MSCDTFGHWLTDEVGYFDPEDWFGYIYKIKNNINNKCYVGRKQFKNLTKLKPLKGRVNKRHRYKDSGWRQYCSSSQYVLDDIDAFGKCNFTFTIIHLCKNKSQVAYYEPYYMYKYNVLTQRDSLGNRVYYNKVIPGCKCIPKL